MKHRIVFLDQLTLTPTHIAKLKKLGSVRLAETAWPTEKDLLRLVAPSTILISKWINIGEKILAAAPNLKYAVMAMTGYHDWVDVQAAQKYNVKVSNVPVF